MPLDRFSQGNARPATNEPPPFLAISQQRVRQQKRGLQQRTGLHNHELQTYYTHSWFADWPFALQKWPGELECMFAACIEVIDIIRLLSQQKPRLDWPAELSHACLESRLHADYRLATCSRSMQTSAAGLFLDSMHENHNDG